MCNQEDCSTKKIVADNDPPTPGQPAKDPWDKKLEIKEQPKGTPVDDGFKDEGNNKQRLALLKLNKDLAKSCPGANCRCFPDEKVPPSEEIYTLPVNVTSTDSSGTIWTTSGYVRVKLIVQKGRCFTDYKVASVAPSSPFGEFLAQLEPSARPDPWSIDKLISALPERERRVLTEAPGAGGKRRDG